VSPYVPPTELQLRADEEASRKWGRYGIPAGVWVTPPVDVIEFAPPARCACGGHPFERGRCLFCVAIEADRRAAEAVRWFDEQQRAEARRAR
jgi:hypothetical protein